MEKTKRFKECNKHEKRFTEQDLMRICETCTRTYFKCEICRAARNIQAPGNICKSPKLYV